MSLLPVGWVVSSVSSELLAPPARNDTQIRACLLYLHAPDAAFHSFAEGYQVFYLLRAHCTML